MSVDTPTGAILITEQVCQILVQPLEAGSVVLAAGPRIFDSSELLRIPYLEGKGAETDGASILFTSGEVILPPIWASG